MRGDSAGRTSPLPKVSFISESKARREKRRENGVQKRGNESCSKTPVRPRASISWRQSMVAIISSCVPPSSPFSHAGKDPRGAQIEFRPASYPQKTKIRRRVTSSCSRMSSPEKTEDLKDCLCPRHFPLRHLRLQKNLSDSEAAPRREQMPLVQLSILALSSSQDEPCRCTRSETQTGIKMQLATIEENAKLLTVSFSLETF